MTELVERIAWIIDPEAFGLPEPDRSAELGSYLTDRDEARARARAVIAAIRESTPGMIEGISEGLRYDMVDRVARALFYARFSSENYDSRLFAEARKVCLRDAVVMIGAMREPTYAMVENSAPIAGENPSHRQIWQEMIDAALGKPSGA